MTADTVFKFYRVYKLYYQGTYDFKKYRGNLKMPPLIQQPERRFYYRIAQKLTDPQVHALYSTGFFFNPRAYVTDLATPAAFTAAVSFASRAENGRTLMEADLYELRKRLQDVDLDAWLYGEFIGHERATIPGCLQDVISGTLPLDVACAILLIPQPARAFHWTTFWQPTTFGAHVWVERLRLLDRLLMLQRPGWRSTNYDLAKDFWATMGQAPLSPIQRTKPVTLFDE